MFGQFISEKKVQKLSNLNKIKLELFENYLLKDSFHNINKTKLQNYVQIDLFNVNELNQQCTINLLSALFGCLNFFSFLKKKFFKVFY